MESPSRLNHRNMFRLVLNNYLLTFYVSVLPRLSNLEKLRMLISPNTPSIAKHLFVKQKHFIFWKKNSTLALCLHYIQPVTTLHLCISHHLCKDSRSLPKKHTQMGEGRELAVWSTGIPGISLNLSLQRHTRGKANSQAQDPQLSQTHTDSTTSTAQLQGRPNCGVRQQGQTDSTLAKRLHLQIQVLSRSLLLPAPQNSPPGAGSLPASPGCPQPPTRGSFPLADSVSRAVVTSTRAASPLREQK